LLGAEDDLIGQNRPTKSIVHASCCRGRGKKSVNWSPDAEMEK